MILARCAIANEVRDVGGGGKIRQAGNAAMLADHFAAGGVGAFSVM
jgi:hypothetical protein